MQPSTTPTGTTTDWPATAARWREGVSGTVIVASGVTQLPIIGLRITQNESL